MQLPDIEFASKDIGLQEFYDTTRIILNNGRTQFRVVSEIPTWVGTEGELIFYSAGNVRRVYTYISDSWTYFGFMDVGGQVLVDGQLVIGSYLKADDKSGLWLGHNAWASAPFRVNLAGDLWATSAVISGNITALSGLIGGWTIGASSLYSTNLQIDSGNERIQTSNFVSGALGTGWRLGGPNEDYTAEFNNIRARGKISASVFEKNTISAIGGNLLVADSDILDTDMTALDSSTLTITGDTTFAVNDILRMKDKGDDEWLEVTNIGSAPTYTVTRDKAGVYTTNINPIWKKGTCVVNYGASGEGLIYITASDANAPSINVITHAGSPWTTTTTRVSIGLLT